MREERPPLVSDQHLAAAERLRQTFEATAEGVGLFGSSVTWTRINLPVAGAANPLAMVGRLTSQLAERREWLSARSYLGPLWPALETVVLGGSDVKFLAMQRDWSEPMALGYLIAALDKLVVFYATTDAGPPVGRTGIRAAAIS